MSLDPSSLLAGPRGRRLCLELLLSFARDQGGPGEDASQAVFWASHALDPNPGTLLTIGEGAEDFVTPSVSPAHAAEALRGVRLSDPTPTELRLALAASVDHAMYWQPPDGRCILAASDELRTVLAPVAAVVAASPHAQWWAEPVERDDQWTVDWAGDPPRATSPDIARVLEDHHAAVDAEEARSARERPRDPQAAYSGQWWSTPPGALVSTTRGSRADGPSGLWFVEDSLGWSEATATSVETPAARVWEIDGAQAWAELCRRHPSIVTASRRHDWYRTTGRDGEWVQPDWPAVAGEVDAVHLSISGYLEAATTVIEVGDGRASVIAGWAPDATYWFVPVERRGQSVRWTCEEDAWVRA